MPADDVTVCEPEPPISEAPLPTPEDWYTLYVKAQALCDTVYCAPNLQHLACEILHAEIHRMRPTYLRLKANHEDLR